MDTSTTESSPLKLWTVKEFHDLNDRGFFEGRWAKLIHGCILEEGQMSPAHANALVMLHELFIQHLPREHWHVRSQKPLVLDERTDPILDIAVVAGRPGDYTSHTTTAALIVEISDTSLLFDTTKKMSLYSRAGIPEYWVLDLNTKTLVIHRLPITVEDDRASEILDEHNYYTDVQTVGKDGNVSPLEFPTLQLAVSEMIP